MPCCFAYQTLPSEPVAMPTGPILVTVVSKRVNIPAGVMREMALGPVFSLLNHRFPSLPATIRPGLSAVGIGNSMIEMLGPLLLAAPLVPGAPLEPGLPPLPPLG